MKDDGHVASRVRRRQHSSIYSTELPRHKAVGREQECKFSICPSILGVYKQTLRDS